MAYVPFLGHGGEVGDVVGVGGKVMEKKFVSIITKALLLWSLEMQLKVTLSYFIFLWTCKYYCI